MAVFEWRQKESTHFGKVWVPIVVAQFRSAAGSFKKLHMFVDSGAIVSLVRRSFAEELGVALETGRRIQLTNVAGGHSDAIVHDVMMRLDDDELPTAVPVAVAVREDVPNLLGRLGVFDRRRIEFDPQARITRIDPPTS